MEIFCRDAGRRALHDGLFPLRPMQGGDMVDSTMGDPTMENPNCNYTAGEYEYR